MRDNKFLLLENVFMNLCSEINVAKSCAKKDLKLEYEFNPE